MTIAIQRLIQEYVTTYDLSDPATMTELIREIDKEVGLLRRDSYESGRQRGKAEVYVALQELLAQRGG